MDDHLEERIRIAEAMGARRVSEGEDYFWPPTYWIEAAKAAGAIAFDYVHAADLPDPWIDANHDYAILEWARNAVIKKFGKFPNLQPKWAKDDNWWVFFTELRDPTDYEKGDYANAALKYLDSLEVSCHG